MNSLTQGVTTEMLNPDGGYPVYLPGSTSAQLRIYSALGLAIDIGTYTGFNTKWSSVVGKKDRAATRAEITAMRRSIRKDLEQGPSASPPGSTKPGQLRIDPRGRPGRERRPPLAHELPQPRAAHPGERGALVGRDRRDPR